MSVGRVDVGVRQSTGSILHKHQNRKAFPAVRQTGAPVHVEQSRARSRAAASRARARRAAPAPARLRRRRCARSRRTTGSRETGLPGRHAAVASAPSRSSSNTTGAFGSSKRADAGAGAARPSSRPRLPSIDDAAPTGPDAAPGARSARVVSVTRRGQRLEVALDVEEVDVARRLAPLLGQRGSEREPADAQRLLVAAGRARWKTRPTSKMRTRDILRLTLVAQRLDQPGQQRRAHHVEMRGDRIQDLDRLARPDRARASVADDDEAERDDLLPVEVDQRALDRDARALRLRGRAACAATCARGVGGNRCRSRGCARPPRRSPPRSRDRSGATAASR